MGGEQQAHNITGNRYVREGQAFRISEELTVSADSTEYLFVENVSTEGIEVYVENTRFFATNESDFRTYSNVTEDSQGSQVEVSNLRLDSGVSDHVDAFVGGSYSDLGESFAVTLIQAAGSNNKSIPSGDTMETTAILGSEASNFLIEIVNNEGSEMEATVQIVFHEEPLT